MNGVNKYSSNVKIFDNGRKPPSETHFVKYRTINKYYDDYFSSSDEDDEADLMKIEAMESKLDLTEVAKKVETLPELIKLCDMLPAEFKPCNRGDLGRLKRIKQPLEELNRLIGMTDLKKKIINHCFYYCQDLHNIKPPPGFENEGDLMHTVIQGEPGCGKTTVAKILGKIYLRLGVLRSDKFVTAKSKDLIAEYVGQTAPRTTKVLESALGGVLFIDEAYSLGNEEKRALYGKECADALNQYLSEHKKDILVIIAGYKNDLKTCFFSLNKGLERRFPWVYDIKKYTVPELRQIFIKQVRESGWGFVDDHPDKIISDDFIEKHKDYFAFGGGDTETFFQKCKEAHSKNTFGLAPDKKGFLTRGDIICGMEMHKEAHDSKKGEVSKPPPGMYL